MAFLALTSLLIDKFNRLLWHPVYFFLFTSLFHLFSHSSLTTFISFHISLLPYQWDSGFKNDSCVLLENPGYMFKITPWKLSSSAISLIWILHIVMSILYSDSQLAPGHLFIFLKKYLENKTPKFYLENLYCHLFTHYCK